MATDAKSTEAPKANGPKKEPRKLADDFKPNEPKDADKSGVDDQGNADGSLGLQQAQRAQTEALLSLRPQPSADEIQKVLADLTAKKFKSAKEAGDAAVAALNAG